MEGPEIVARTGEELVRFVRALGRHRYVAGSLHLVHAFAIEAARESLPGPLESAVDWAKSVLDDREIDQDSKDPRLVRRASDEELVAVLEAFWSASPDERGRAHERLRARLGGLDLPPPDGRALPFDESREDEMYPVLIDAGWELHPLRALDPERHRGAISAFGEALSWESAKFEEESAVPPVPVLHELPLVGAVELLDAFDEDDHGVRAPFVLWMTGHPVYLDYVLRGVLRAAKLEMT